MFDVGRAKWDTSCPDWRDLLKARKPPIPRLPLFDAEAEKALRIFKRLRCPDIEGNPRYGELCDEWVFAIVAAIFGSYDIETKRRLIREFFVLIPKKNGKSSIAAAIVVVALIMNRRPEAECLLIAPTKTIANISFKQAAGIIRLDPQLAKIFHLQQHLRTITHRTLLSQIVIKAADTDAITGSKSTFVLIDETHVFATIGKAADVFIEIRGALAARPDGWLLQITTQSKEPPAGVFKSELDAAREVRDGKVQRPVLAILYEFPQDIQDSGAWKLPENWDMVNPNLGRSVDRAFLGDELLKAERAGPEALALFASQHFNIEIGMALRSTRWEGADFWIDQADEALADLETLLDRSDLVVVGIDGGGLEDLLGLAVMGRDMLSRDWLLWTHAWAHRKILERHTQIAPALVDFQRAGNLTIYETPGDDVEELVSIIQTVEDSGKMPEKAAIGVDIVGITEIVDGLEQAGLLPNPERVVGVGQGWKLANTIKTTARRLAAGTLWHSGAGLMTWSVGHAIVEPRGNAILITKATAGAGKIDPLMATFNAVALMAKNPEGQGRSFWDRSSSARPEHN
jgi:phage terminase large subunit-like protein